MRPPQSEAPARANAHAPIRFRAFPANAVCSIRRLLRRLSLLRVPRQRSVGARGIEAPLFNKADAIERPRRREVASVHPRTRPRLKADSSRPRLRTVLRQACCSDCRGGARDHRHPHREKASRAAQHANSPAGLRAMPSMVFDGSMPSAAGKQRTASTGSEDKCLRPSLDPGPASAARIKRERPVSYPRRPGNCPPRRLDGVFRHRHLFVPADRRMSTPSGRFLSPLKSSSHFIISHSPFRMVVQEALRSLAAVRGPRSECAAIGGMHRARRTRTCRRAVRYGRVLRDRHGAPEQRPARPCAKATRRPGRSADSSVAEPPAAAFTSPALVLHDRLLRAART